MATPIPPSWQLAGSSADPWVLTDWGISYSSSPANPIYWVQAVDKMSAGGLETHCNQPSTGQEVFLTSFGTLNSADYRILRLSILGGFDENTDQMFPQWAHPQDANLYATSLAVRSGYVDNTNTPGSGSMFPYRVAFCRVGFQSLPYYVNQGTGMNPFNPNWIEVRPNAVNQAFTAPVGNYVFTAGPFIGKQAPLGTFYPGGLVYLEYVLHGIPLYPFLSELVQPTPLGWTGVVNSMTFDGYDANTLMIQSADPGDGSWGDPLGQNPLVAAHIHMIFNPNEWNTSLAPDGAWYTVGAAYGLAPPIPTLDFNTLFSDIIPPQA